VAARSDFGVGGAGVGHGGLDGLRGVRELGGDVLQGGVVLRDQTLHAVADFVGCVGAVDFGLVVINVSICHFTLHNGALNGAPLVARMFARAGAAGKRPEMGTGADADADGRGYGHTDADTETGTGTETDADTASNRPGRGHGLGRTPCGIGRAGARSSVPPTITLLAQWQSFWRPSSIR
jgi:hypothetical protein